MIKFTNVIRITGMLIIAMFSILTAFGQQKITIKNQDNIGVGHFIVETFHKEGSKLNKLTGNIPSFQAKEDVNTFLIQLSNLLWYEPDNESNLSIIVDKISSSTNEDVSFLQSGKTFELKYENGQPVAIEVQVTESGEYKFNIPFFAKNFSGRFVQFLSVKTAELTSSKDVKEDWKMLDMENLEAVQSFIKKYKDQELAKKYVNSAERIQFKLEREKASGINGEDTSATNMRDIDNMEGDVARIIESDAEIDYTPDLSTKDRKVFLQVNDGTVHEIELNNAEIPLQLRFLSSGESESALENIIAGLEFNQDTMLKITPEMLIENKIEGNFESLEIYNAFNKKVFESPLTDMVTLKKNYTSYIIMGLFGLLAVIGGFVYLNNKKQETKKKKIKDSLADKISMHQASMKSTAAIDEVESNLPNSGNKQVQKLKINKVQSKKEVSASNLGASSGGGIRNEKIKILKRKVQRSSLDQVAFDEILANQKSVHVNLSDIWKETAIKEVHMTDVFIEELDHFLADSSTEGIKNELQGAIPEVGGFLMGRFKEVESNIDLIIEKFVPFVPEYNDVFKIEIGTKTLVEELGDAQDKFPQLDVIGWFHTHPGHGLFLSISDLGVQRHFPKQFQVAMEIDSLTENLDMSLFSRKMNGQINNTQDRIEGKTWFKWVDIEKSISKI